MAWHGRSADHEQQLVLRRVETREGEKSWDGRRRRGEEEEEGRRGGGEEEVLTEEGAGSRKCDGFVLSTEPRGLYVCGRELFWRIFVVVVVVELVLVMMTVVSCARCCVSYDRMMCLIGSHAVYPMIA
eukprot:2786466-Rhodomonas_salina.1